MTKRRKRSSKTCPAKGRMRDMADRLWSKAVIADWDFHCAVCRSRTNLNAHHLIPRQHTVYRYDLRNGICLCAHCHQFCPHTSPHQNAAGWILWLEQHQPALSEWYIDAVDGDNAEIITKNVEFYCDTIRRLKDYVDDDVYRSIVGVRFADYLDEHAHAIDTDSET
jgi:hypothetical protein